MTDFRFISYGTVATFEAISPAAKTFANEHFPVEDWMGTPTKFTTDWRAAESLARQMHEEGWKVVVR